MERRVRHVRLVQQLQAAMIAPHPDHATTTVVTTAGKTINSLVNRAHITGLVGYADGGGSINVQGEEQKTLDVLTNDVLKRALRFTGPAIQGLLELEVWFCGRRSRQRGACGASH